MPRIVTDIRGLQPPDQFSFGLVCVNPRVIPTVGKVDSRSRHSQTVVLGLFIVILGLDPRICPCGLRAKVPRSGVASRDARVEPEHDEIGQPCVNLSAGWYHREQSEAISVSGDWESASLCSR